MGGVDVGDLVDDGLLVSSHLLNFRGAVLEGQRVLVEEDHEVVEGRNAVALILDRAADFVQGAAKVGQLTGHVVHADRELVEAIREFAGLGEGRVGGGAGGVQLI